MEAINILTIMSNILIILSTGIVCLFSFYFGSILNSNREEHISNKEIKLPNPIKAYKEHREKEEASKEREKINIIMQNIDNYDGTENGQRDLPQ